MAKPLFIVDPKQMTFAICTDRKCYICGRELLNAKLQKDTSNLGSIGFGRMKAPSVSSECSNSKEDGNVNRGGEMKFV